jgi:hypothetical protein
MSALETLIMNGNAEYSIHSYPTEAFGGRLTVETSGNGNNFFRTGFRTSDMNSVSNSMAAPGCMIVGARHKVSVRSALNLIRTSSRKCAFASSFEMVILPELT